jgi:EAL domain-containing protein (putative c-di-GMP-specific phosphodiesterase class I)
MDLRHTKAAGAEGVRGGRLLVADDEPALCGLMAEILEGEGFEVAVCANGLTALELLKRDAFDAVVSDVNMPDMDGLGLLAAVRQMDLDLPVVLMTGGPTLETAVKAVEAGALRYLTKPVGAQQLIEAAHQAVRLGRLGRLKREALAASGFDQLPGDRAGLEASFGRALAQLWMAGQPIVRAFDGEVCAHEVLVRTDAQLFPHPGALLNAAERLDRLPDLGRAIRAEVAALLQAGVLSGDVFVNLHPLDLVDDALIDPSAPLSRFASRVVLEVTERANLERVAELPSRVQRLRLLGYRIAIDDLGAGYAGLTSFAALTPEIVKLDMALIRGLDRDPVKQKLVLSMGRLCLDLGIQVVAEGIETDAERRAAIACGCGLLQGFLIGKPARLPLPRGSPARREGS